MCFGSSLGVLVAAGVVLGGDGRGPSQRQPDAQPVRSAMRDLRSVPADLQTPLMLDADPAPGKRVRQVLPEYRRTQVYHVLYLPEDWRPGGRYPVIVEYAGNGPYADRLGDICTGRPEGCNLGYGISGGKGFLWICLPYINAEKTAIQLQWWGDVEATIDYCRKAVRHVCEEFGGDPAAVILAGFSRGAIACGYLGLHDDQIADVWLAFVAYSHYDGVTAWGYPGSDPASARTRLARLKGRASFICQERTVEPTRKFLASTGIRAPFTFQVSPFVNHNDAWVLRDVPERQVLRTWLAEVLRTKPGTRAIRGRVIDQAGRPLAGVRVESGWTHWTTTDADGRYELAGLVSGRRSVAASKPGFTFQPPAQEVLLLDSDIQTVAFVGLP